MTVLNGAKTLTKCIQETLLGAALLRDGLLVSRTAPSLKHPTKMKIKTRGRIATSTTTFTPLSFSTRAITATGLMVFGMKQTWEGLTVSMMTSRETPVETHVQVGMILILKVVDFTIPRTLRPAFSAAFANLKRFKITVNVPIMTASKIKRGTRVQVGMTRIQRDAEDGILIHSSLPMLVVPVEAETKMGLLKIPEHALMIILLLIAQEILANPGTTTFQLLVDYMILLSSNHRKRAAFVEADRALQIKAPLVIHRHQLMAV